MGLLFTTIRFDGDNTVLVNENLVCVGLDHQSEPIEPLQLAHEPFTGRQLNRHRLVCFQGLKQEPVLDVDCRLCHLLLPIPGA